MKSMEIIELKERIADLSRDINSSEKYIEHLNSRYTNPSDTVNKYQEKLRLLRRERHECKKELVVLEKM